MQRHRNLYKSTTYAKMSAADKVPPTSKAGKDVMRIRRPAGTLVRKSSGRRRDRQDAGIELASIR